MKKKRENCDAFTLAEVLVTLVIVGIIAALTIPGVVIKYQKEQTAIKLKKAYSVLYNAYRDAVINNGSADTWNYDLSNKEFYLKYLAPYLNGIYCDVTKGVCRQGNVVFPDGTYISFLNLKPIYGDKVVNIYIDINGLRGKSVRGKDVFIVGINGRPNGGSSRCKYYERFGFSCQWCGACVYEGKSNIAKNRGMWKNACNGPSAYGGNNNCGGLIEFDGWKIKDDYPW